MRGARRRGPALLRSAAAAGPRGRTFRGTPRGRAGARRGVRPRGRAHARARRDCWRRPSASTNGVWYTRTRATSTAFASTLLAHPARRPVREIVVTVGDWIADPNGPVHGGLRSADAPAADSRPSTSSPPTDCSAQDSISASTSGCRESKRWRPSRSVSRAAPSARPVLEVPDVGADASSSCVATARRS